VCSETGSSKKTDRRLIRLDIPINQHRDEVQKSLFDWFMKCPAEFAITLTFQDVPPGIVRTEKLVERWVNKQAERFMSDIALMGVFTGKNGRPHVHAILWGRDDGGHSLTDNPRFFISRLREKNLRYWPGFIHARDFRLHSRATQVGYLCYSNYDTRLYEPLAYATNKKLFKEVMQ